MSDTPPSPPPTAYAATGTASHTRSLSVTHTNVNVSRTGPLTSVPADLPQLTVTTPSTVYSEYTPGTYGTSPSPPSAEYPVPPLPASYAIEQGPIGGDVGSDGKGPIELAAVPLPVSPPAVMITSPTPGSTPTPSQTKFASPAMANPNAPVLPRLATPGVAHLRNGASSNSRNSPPRATAAAAASSGTNGTPRSASPPAFGKIRAAVNTMSPVQAARSYNERNNARLKLQTGGAGTSTPTATTANQLYVQTLMSATKGKGERSQADRVIGRETLFDLDADDEEGGDDDAKELPLEDLLSEELPEYIQVFLTPHPDGGDVKEKGKEKEGYVDEKRAMSEKDDEAWRAAKWSDIEASLPAYTSKASLKLKQSGASPSGSPSAGPAPTQPSKKKPLIRRIIPRKPSSRLLCCAIVLLLLVVIPLIVFGIVFALETRGPGHHKDSGPPAATAAPAPSGQNAGNGAEVPDAGVGDANGTRNAPVVAPMTGDPAPTPASDADGPPQAIIVPTPAPGTQVDGDGGAARDNKDGN